MRNLLFVLTALTALSLLAGYQVNVSAWRGETVVVRGHDYIDPITLPKGVTLRRGVIERVDYLEPVRKGAVQYRSCADRVVWGSTAFGPKVLEFTIDRKVKAGVYDCGDVQLTVVDRELPPAKEWKYVLDLWQHPWAVSRVKGVKPFSKRHYEEMRPFWKMLADAGQKFLTVTLIDEPWNHQCYDAYHSMVEKRRNAKGEWTYDFSLLDEYVEFGRSCGIGPKIACYTMCPWEYRVDWIDEDGKVQKAAARPGESFFEEYWTPYLRALDRHFREKGWIDDVYIAMDERSPQDVDNIVKLVRKVAPGLKISMAGNRKPSEFRGIEIDCYSQGLRDFALGLKDELPARKAKGQITTWYVCCNPAQPNTFMNSKSGEAFWCGFYPAVSGVDGFLRWAWNSWGENSLHDASYERWYQAPGDIFLVYPDGSPSWRFIELKRGIVAAEKYRILIESGEMAAELKELADKFDAKSALDGTCEYDVLENATLKLVNKPR